MGRATIATRFAEWRVAGNEKLRDAQSVLNSFRRIVKSLRLADRAGLKEHGLGASQLYVLHELKRESPLSVNELARRTATDQSTVSVVVAKLIEKGFVARERSEQDARRLDLTVTAKGNRLLERLPPPIQWSIIEGVQRLPRARARALAESLEEICQVLGIADTQPPMLMDDGGPPPVRKRSSKRPASRR
ncbi:MAG: MarR family winged helix-turn-helix transcriptional regulator [Thermoanaerobaculia bacterium]